MDTVDGLRAQIAATAQLLQQAEADRRSLELEAGEATARQLLRRQLEQIQQKMQDKEAMKDFWRGHRRDIDRDLSGPHMRQGRSYFAQTYGKLHEPTGTLGVLDCSAAVVSGELEWTIKGFSWLRETLAQQDEGFALSRSTDVGGHLFRLLYHPTKGKMGAFEERGSLAINHDEHPDYTGVTFRYSIWIKSRKRGYVQWGDSGNICTSDDSDDMLFGPDVCKSPGSAIPMGIFGMSHEQLEKSEWVTNDQLTTKLKIEVRTVSDEQTKTPVADGIAVPPPCLSDQILLLLHSGVNSDVTFIVQGEAIRAHSQILSARSEVLQRQFACGMQESVSKEVTIEDCTAVIFKAFLRYLYSDNFDSLDNFIKENVQEPSSSSEPNLTSTGSIAAHTTTGNGAKMSMLQQLLALSHKYQQSRLQLWCERELCECISVEHVCSVLCQAHLYDARKLGEKCLIYIKENMADVVKTDAFGSLCTEWPEVSLKITLHLAALPENVAATALEKQENARKRKRKSD